MNIAMDLIREALLGGSGGGGGGGGMTKVFEKTYTISTESTSETVVDNTLENILEPGSWYYYCAIDTAGERDGYFYGLECFMRQVVWGPGTSFDNRVAGFLYAVNNNGSPYFYVTPTYGVYPKATSKTAMSICAKYSSTYTRIINGDYKVTIYKLSEPAPIMGGV